MIAGSPLGLLGSYMLPYVLLGAALWLWVLVRAVPASRWREPEHWIKTIVLTAFVSVGVIALSFLLSIVTAALLSWVT